LTKLIALKKTLQEFIFMRYLILFAGLFYFSMAAAQEPATVIQLSLDAKSCHEGVQYQINVQVCNPAGYEDTGETGRQRSSYDWSNFTGIDASFQCDEHYSSMGCDANFRSPGYGLDKVLNISVLRIRGEEMDMMQILVPVTRADEQTVIDIRNIPFRPGSFNLKGRLKAESVSSRGNTLLLTPAEGAF